MSLTSATGFQSEIISAGKLLPSQWACAVAHPLWKTAQLFFQEYTWRSQDTLHLHPRHIPRRPEVTPESLMAVDDSVTLVKGAKTRVRQQMKGSTKCMAFIQRNTIQA